MFLYFLFQTELSVFDRIRKINEKKKRKTEKLKHFVKGFISMCSFFFLIHALGIIIL